MWRVTNRRGRLLLETADLLEANQFFGFRSRRGWYSKLYLRDWTGAWSLCAWGIHDSGPSWQERTRPLRIAAREEKSA